MLVIRSSMVKEVCRFLSCFLSTYSVILYDAIWRLNINATVYRIVSGFKFIDLVSSGMLKVG